MSKLIILVGQKYHLRGYKLANKTVVTGGTGTGPKGIAKRKVESIKNEWQQIDDDLNVNWSSFDAAQKQATLLAQARFAHKVQRYFLIARFGD